MELRLPRTWNEQFALLVGLLYLQCVAFFLVVHLTSPVFDAPASERYALHNQVDPSAPWVDHEGLGLLDSARWHLQSMADYAAALASGHVHSSTHPSLSPMLPSRGSAPLLHAHPRRDQVRPHVHSGSPYMFRYLEHVARAYPTREQLQKHMMEHTMREGVWARGVSIQAETTKDAIQTQANSPAQAQQQQLPPTTVDAAPTSNEVKAPPVSSPPQQQQQQLPQPLPPPPVQPPLPPPSPSLQQPPSPVRPARRRLPPQPIVPETAAMALASRTVISEWGSSSAPTSEECLATVGSGMLREWEGTNKVFCAPVTPSALVEAAEAKTVASGAAPGALGAVSDHHVLRTLLDRYAAGGAVDENIEVPWGSLECRSTTLPLLPPATAPHSYCVGRHVFLDLSGLTPASAPKHRAGYVMGHMNHYHSAGGTYSARCTPTHGGHGNAAQIATISADHQRDIVDSFRTIHEKQEELWKAFVSTRAKQGPRAEREDREFMANLPLQSAATAAATAARAVDAATTAAAAAGGDANLPLLQSPSTLPSSVPPPLPAPALLVLPHTVLVVTRENGEHCNFFHTLTDLYNAYLMFRGLNLVAKEVQVLFNDNHGPSPFDEAWERVYSGAGPLLKMHQIMEAPEGNKMQIFASSMVLSPPGYSSPLYRSLFEPDPLCRPESGAGSDLLRGFGSFFLEAFGIEHQRWQRGKTMQQMTGIGEQESRAAFRLSVEPGPRPTLGGTKTAARALLQAAAAGLDASSAGDVESDDDGPLTDIGGVLHIVLVSRRPYDHFVSHTKIARQILNEDSLMDFITTKPVKSDEEKASSSGDSGRQSDDEPGPYDDVRLDVVDLARLGFEQQLKLMASTDILIGMHGALHPMMQRWQCFAHQTEWMGRSYFSWRNNDLRQEGEVLTGSGVKVDPVTFRKVVDHAIAAVRRKRRALEKEIKSKNT